MALALRDNNRLSVFSYRMEIIVIHNRVYLSLRYFSHQHQLWGFRWIWILSVSRVGSIYAS